MISNETDGVKKMKAILFCLRNFIFRCMLFYCSLIFISSAALSETITVGCATKCDFFFTLALNKAAHYHNVTVRILDVSKDGPKTEWEKYDAIIFPGGADIDPKFYLPHVEQDLQEYTRSLDHLVKYSAEGRRRDPIEFNLLKDYFSRVDLINLPVLGVCRGMQMLAVSQGIPLYVDIKRELGIKNRRYLWDRIHMDADEPYSLIKELFRSSFKAFKRHHQGVRVKYFNENQQRWPEIRLTAFSNHNLIAEAIEFENRPVLGVQFHPENDFGFERKRIFGWLISQALKRKYNDKKKQNRQKFISNPADNLISTILHDPVHRTLPPTL